MKFPSPRLFVLASAFLGLALSASTRAAVQGGDFPGTGISCPATVTHSSTASHDYGPYATSPSAGAISAAEAQALSDEASQAAGTCPDNCTASPTIACFGNADFSSEPAAGSVIQSGGRYWIRVIVNINASYTCSCDN